jgi:uncharacterized protein YkwD
MVLTMSFNLSSLRSAHDAAPRLGGHRRLLTVLGVVLGLIAPLLVVAAPAASARTTTESRIDTAVLKLLNAERKAHHLKPLVSDSHLRLSARRHNLTMAKFNTMSHQLPREAFFATRITKAGFKGWHYAGENIAWNSQMTTHGAQVVQKMMYNERAPYNGHRLNILSKRYKKVGVDIYLDRKHHKLWLTTDYAAR